MWTSLDKNKTPSEADLKKIQSFVYCKWLAGDYRTIATANTINQYSDIPIENQYYLVKNQFAGKIRNIKYVKSEKDEADATSESAEKTIESVVSGKEESVAESESAETTEETKPSTEEEIIPPSFNFTSVPSANMKATKITARNKPTVIIALFN